MRSSAPPAGQPDSRTAGQQDSRTARRHFHRARARCAALCWRRSGEAVRACVHVRVGGSGPKISRQQTAHFALASRLKERARTPPPPAWLAKGATATAQPERERDAHRLRLAERAARTTDRQHFRRVALHFTRAAEDQPVAARSNALSPLPLALSSSSPECPLLPASLRPCASSLLSHHHHLLLQPFLPFSSSLLFPFRRSGWVSVLGISPHKARLQR